MVQTGAAMATGKIDNPAGRLLAILKRGREHRSTNPAQVVWSQILGIEQADLPLLLHRLGRVYALPQKVQSEIRQIREIDHDVYLKSVSKVATAFKRLNLAAPWDSFIKHVDDVAIHGLEFCDERLSNIAPEQALREDQLTKLHDEVRLLIDEVVKAQIDDKLRAYMLKHLEMVELAIGDYDICGSEPLETSFTTVVGSVALDKETAQNVKDSAFGDRFWGCMGKLAVLLTVVVGATQLPSNIKQILALPEGGTSVSVDADVQATVNMEQPSEPADPGPEPSAQRHGT